MQCDADGAAGHSKFDADLRHRSPLDRGRPDDPLLAGVEMDKESFDIASRALVRCRRGNRFGYFLDLVVDPDFLATQHIDYLVTNNRIHPGAEGLCRVPGPALEVNREKDFLNDVLDIRVSTLAMSPSSIS